MTEAAITITLRVNHALQGFVPKRMIDKDMAVKIQKDARVEDILREVVGLSPKVVPLIFVNGRHAKPSDRLASRDRVTLWMPMAGG